MSGAGGVPIGFTVALAAVIGLFVGSFLNVVVYRVPLGLSVSTPRSFCPTCDRQLRWWENIPVVSWLALRGRCHRCHEPVSVRYPVVEATTALAFAGVVWAWHGSSLGIGYCILAATAISVALIEWGGARSPLSVAAIGTGLGVVAVVAAASWLQRWTIVTGSLVGLAVGVLVFAVLRSRDPDCRDPRGHGRTLLLVAGAWLGGLGGVATRGAWPVAWGMVGWIVAALSCLIVLRFVGPDAGADGGADVGAVAGPVDLPVRNRWRWLLPVASAPLATGAVVGLAVSLTVAG